MSKYQTWRLIASVALFCLCCSGLAAQEFRASMTGQVTDPSGATVAGAQVRAVNRDTQQAYNVKTTDKGDYFIPYILPGNYTVTVTSPGFKTQVQNSVVLQAGKSTGLNFALQLGAASQTVEVTVTWLDFVSQS